MILISFFFVIKSCDSYTLGFAELVHNRYYCINRVKKAVNFLISTAKRTDYLWVDLFIEKEKIAYFTNETVVQALQMLVEHHDMHPIVLLWDQFKRYHHVLDVTFLDETMRAIALIALALAMDVSHKITVRDIDKAQFFQDKFFEKVPLHELFSVIKQCCNYISHAHDNSTVINVTLFDQKNTDWQDHGMLLHIDTIAERFYYINRLERSVQVLHSAYDYYEHSNNSSLLVLSDSNVSLHPRISSCIHKMQGQGALAPLLATWESVKEYEYVQERQFVHDFSRLLFLYYRNVYLYYAQTKARITNEQQSVLEKIALVYQKIEKLPIEEIISVIDVLMNDLPVLMQQCELQSTISWNQWLKKYWWAPTLLSVNVFLRVVKKLFGKNFLNSFASHNSDISSGNSVPFFSLE